MIYEFVKDIAVRYRCYVEADSLEEACEKRDLEQFYYDMSWEEEDNESYEAYTATRMAKSVPDLDDGEYETLEEWNAFERY